MYSSSLNNPDRVMTVLSHEILTVALLFLLAFFIRKMVVIVPGQTAYVIEFLGKPQRVLSSGMHICMPLLTRIAHKVSLSQEQLEVTSDVKTKDDVFISLRWVLLYAVQNTDESIMNYAYKVEEPTKRLIFKAENEIRQLSSEMTLDEMYSKRDGIGARVMGDQAAEAKEYGVQIVGVTIEQPKPPGAIQEAMNSKLAAKARKDAAAMEAEATRIRIVGEAQADAESKLLQGQGIANERKAIAEGFREAAELLRAGMGDLSEKDVVAMMLAINQTDMVVNAARTGRTSTIFVPTDMSQMTLGQTLSKLQASEAAN